MNGGKAYRVSGKNVVLACYNGVIPFLCPEMPEPQRKALAYGVKTPLVYTNVLIRNWTSFQKLGVERIYYPGGYHSSASLDFPVSLGSYRHPRTPDEPMLLHLVRFFVTPGRPLRNSISSESGTFYRRASTLSSAPFEISSDDLFRRWVRPRAGHPGDNREPLASRVCVQLHAAHGSDLVTTSGRTWSGGSPSAGFT